jgi:hypothetical protein
MDPADSVQQDTTPFFQTLQSLKLWTEIQHRSSFWCFVYLYILSQLHVHAESINNHLLKDLHSNV